MPKYTAVTNTEIKDDSLLVNFFKDASAKGKIKFITGSTKESISKLIADTDIHYQADLLNAIWELLVVDAISFLKRKDTREKYHDHMTLGTDELCSFLKEFQRFEPMLYGSVPHYRDHIAHVLRVYLLGQYVIKTSIGFENISFSKDELVTPSEKEAMWCVIALTHDLGISLEKVHIINQSVRSMLQKFGNIPVQEIGHSYFAQFGPISEYVVKFLSSDVAETKKGGGFATHVQSKYYQKFLAALGDFNHGVMSSIILMKDLVYFKEADYTLDQTKLLDGDDARQFMIRREILRAIAAHSCDDIYYLGVRNFPFLLTMCDEMQEWGRPRLVDIFKRGESSTKLTINKLDDKTVDYRVTFYFKEGPKPSEAERKNAKIEIIRYCLSKRNKWLNVLRSAVGGNLRNLTLNFEVEDCSYAKKEMYNLKHVTPEDVDIDPKNEDLKKKLPTSQYS